uniref:Uncharacterized protein n=1 Tax=Cacopsylla melanoneura TaxID=428564 RepID=A0A8D8ZEM0_9HEMI
MAAMVTTPPALFLAFKKQGEKKSQGGIGYADHALSISSLNFMRVYRTELHAGRTDLRVLKRLIVPSRRCDISQTNCITLVYTGMMHYDNDDDIDDKYHGDNDNNNIDD